MKLLEVKFHQAVRSPARPRGPMCETTYFPVEPPLVVEMTDAEVVLKAEGREVRTPRSNLAWYEVEPTQRHFPSPDKDPEVTSPLPKKRGRPRKSKARSS